MASKGNGKLRLLYLIDVFKKYSDEENPLNATDIIERLEEMDIEAERKTIYDDIAILEQYGYDIIKASGAKKGWFLGEREFEVPEIYLLSDAVRSAKFISPKKTRELLAKLNGMISAPRLKKHNLSVYFNISDKSGNENIYYNIDTLNRAIEEKKQVKIKYYSRKFDENRNVYKRVKEMTINPYALAWQDDHYYLLGNHTKYENLIHLRVDRISSALITDEKARHFSEVSEYTERFDTADYLDKLFGMHGGEFEEIKLCCNKKITEPVLDRFSEDIFINNVTEDEFCFSVKAAISQALVTWVMNYGSDLKVLKPESLKEMIKNRAEEILKNY